MQMIIIVVRYRRIYRVFRSIDSLMNGVLILDNLCILNMPFQNTKFLKCGKMARYFRAKNQRKLIVTQHKNQRADFKILPVKISVDLIKFTENTSIEYTPK